jgi:uncharacterized protein
MHFLESIHANLATPAILFFVLGVIATSVKTDLRFPEPLYLALTVYLLAAIGFKGGVAVSSAGLAAVWLPALGAVALGSAIPFWCYGILRYLGRLPAVDAAAIGAHYGSVSAVTFIAAVAYLTRLDEPYEAYASAFLAVMESPAIIVGVVLGKLASDGRALSAGSIMRLALHEGLLGWSSDTSAVSADSRPRRDSSSPPSKAYYRCSCWRWAWSPRADSAICARLDLSSLYSESSCR